MKSRYVSVLLVLLANVLSGSVFAESSLAERKKYHVLCIQSSDNSFVERKRKSLVTEAFRKADIQVELSYVFFRTQDVGVELCKDYLKENLNTYKDTSLDLILAFNDDALNFLIRSDHPLAHRTPIVFSNVILPIDTSNVILSGETLKKYPLITGELETIDYLQAYELGKQLFGEVDELQIAYGFQREDFYLMDMAKAQLMNIPEFAFFRDLSRQTPEEAPVDTIRNPDTIARPLTIGFDLPTIWRHDRLFKYYKNNKPIHRFGIKARGEYIYIHFLSYQLQPFIGVTNAYFRDEDFPSDMPHGVIGGYFNRVDRQVDKAVETSLRILKGEPVESIPIDTGLRTPVFDWEVMQHWGISKSQLPQGSTIVNEPFLIKYKEELIIGAIVAILLLIFLVNYLVKISKIVYLKHNSLQKKLDEEQERMQIMINTISDFIVSIDCNGMIVSINPAARKLFGLKQDEEIQNKVHINSLVKFSPRYKHDVFWLQKVIERSEKTHKEELLPEGSLLVLRNGTSLQISGVVRTLYINDTHIGSLLTFRDCTEKLQKEQFLEFSMQAGDVYTWQIDLKQKLITFHESFFASNAIDRATPTLSQEEFVEMLHPDDRERGDEELAKLLRDTSVNKLKLQLRLRLPAGYIWFEFRITTMPGGVNDPSNVRVFGICLNIQKQKKAEADMQDVLEQARKSNRTKSEFLANMSHEIRTPLNAIVGFSSIINEVEEEEKGQFLELISKNCDMLLQTINDILDISRVESGYPFHYKVCYLKKFLSELWSEEQPLFDKTNVELFLEIPEEECLMETDPFRLKQLLVQLIKNARNFTPQGSVTLGYQYKVGDGAVTIYVRDTGIGIAPEDREIAFERFYKLDQFTSGGGLGLSLCKEITRRFNGSIWITDGYHEKGTCVFVNLPVHPVHQ